MHTGDEPTTLLQKFDFENLPYKAQPIRIVWLSVCKYFHLKTDSRGISTH